MAAKMNAMIMLLALVLLPAIASAGRPRPGKHDKPCNLRGRVYCDPCRVGFETSASKYLQGAKVRLECRLRKTRELVYSDEATTDASGSYVFKVEEDQMDRVCDAILVSSPDRSCKIADPGRDRSRVALTSYNGMISSERFANNLGFMTEKPMAYCSQLLKQYELNDENDA